QNTADAAALAAALDLFHGASVGTSSSSTPLNSANTLVSANSPRSPSLTLYTNQGGTIDALNIPPATGPYAGNSQYAEAIVSLPLSTVFLQVLGVNKSQKVAARAVAGYEPISDGEGAIVLRTDVQPGITLNGNNTRLIVNGGI